MFSVKSSPVIDYSTCLRKSLLEQNIQDNLLALVKETQKYEFMKDNFLNQITKRQDFQLFVKINNKNTTNIIIHFNLLSAYKVIM